MNLSKRLGRAGFVIGFVSPVLFYSVRDSRALYLACPLCPHIDLIGDRLRWLEVGLRVGLVQGLMFALLGFAIGYSIRWFKPSA